MRLSNRSLFLEAWMDAIPAGLSTRSSANDETYAESKVQHSRKATHRLRIVRIGPSLSSRTTAVLTRALATAYQTVAATVIRVSRLSMNVL